MLEIPLLK
jgi:hypothetical protein